MCDGELKAIVKIIECGIDDLLTHYEKEQNICEIALNKMDLAVNLLRESKNNESN